MAEVDVGEVLDDDVEALAADVLDHLLLVVLVVVVEDVVRAALGHHVHTVLGAGSPDDGGSEGPAIEEINSSIIRSDSPNLAFFQGAPLKRRLCTCKMRGFQVNRSARREILPNFPQQLTRIHSCISANSNQYFPFTEVGRRAIKLKLFGIV